MKLLLKQVRSFAELRSATIAPLTILVGENSSGKSSFLALYRIAVAMLQRNQPANFNQEPFFLGAFDQIAHFRGGKYGRDDSFDLGWELDPKDYNNDELPGRSPRIVGTFTKIGSQPHLTTLRFSTGELSWNWRDNGINREFRIRTPSWSGKVPQRFIERHLLGWDNAPSLVEMLEVTCNHERAEVSKALRIPPRTARKLGAELEQLEAAYMACVYRIASGPLKALAPMRTKPGRTYNPIDDTFRPEGEHVPMFLAKTKFGDRKNWERLLGAIDDFGRSSGLFNALRVRTLGKGDSDPFQLEVTMGGPPRNIMDVGYGISQVLPIIVDLTAPSKDDSRIYLLQQPEVHLHPRAQASLGNFLCNVASLPEHTVIVETHSDYLIDRVRMIVRDEKVLRPDEVSILYFERENSQSRIHHLTLDDQGNLLNAPHTYRSFFERETDRLFGIK